MIDQKEDHLTSLYRESFPEFARMIHRMGGTLEQAKDSFHDALLIFMEKERAGTLHQIKTSPKAYLLGTAKICWLHSRDKSAFLPFPEGFEQPAREETDTQERETALLESLQKTGRKCLELLKAFYYDHCSMQDIAERFGFKGRRSSAVQKYKCLEKVRQAIKSTQAYAQ
jgi:DNA-directed RNA polymerase specialized sigma24 family protein